jgi:anti-sigma regulatory factor (Ser/Thr protein kinase)
MPEETITSNNGHRPEGILLGRPGSFRVSLVPDDSAPTRARRALTEFAGELDPEVRERTALVVSELVTNSYKHAGLGESQRIDVEVSVRSEFVRMEVTDPGSGFDIVALRPGTLDGSGGWGLWLIDQMADRWGVDFSHSTCVWCEFDSPDAA